MKPFREELTSIGARELRTPAEVDAFMADKAGTALLVVNSVCGCAAGNARPAVRLALQNARRPSRVATVFAGQDLDATEKARAYFAQFPPSSPSMLLLRDGEVAHFIPRQHIEGRAPQAIAQDLTAAFDRFCAPREAAPKP